MKKFIKLSALILSLILICFCLGGCDEVDETRKKHATWTTPKSIDSITYNGKTYIKVNSELSEKFPSVMYNNVNDNYVHVTDPDVPVLWSKLFGCAMNISLDKNFIEGEYDYYYYGDTDSIPYGNLLTAYDYMYEETALYCNEDIYEYVVNSVESGINYTSYGYRYTDGYDKYGEVISEAYYYLTPNEFNAINEVFDTVEPIIKVEEYMEDEYVIVYLDKISEDKMFATSNYGIYRDSSGKYTLKDNYWKGEEYMQKRYAVPHHLTKTFDKITEKANY